VINTQQLTLLNNIHNANNQWRISQTLHNNVHISMISMIHVIATTGSLPAYTREQWTLHVTDHACEPFSGSSQTAAARNCVMK